GRPDSIQLRQSRQGPVYDGSNEPCCIRKPPFRCVHTRACWKRWAGSYRPEELLARWLSEYRRNRRRYFGGANPSQLYLYSQWTRSLIDRCARLFDDIQV